MVIVISVVWGLDFQIQIMLSLLHTIYKNSNYLRSLFDFGNDLFVCVLYKKTRFEYNIPNRVQAYKYKALWKVFYCPYQYAFQFTTWIGCKMYR